MKNNINVILEIYLIFPYKKSLFLLFDFCFIWGCKIIRSSTKKEKAIISISQNNFKKIFGNNPRLNYKYMPDKILKDFISHIKVKKIKIK